MYLTEPKMALGRHRKIWVFQLIQLGTTQSAVCRLMGELCLSKTLSITQPMDIVSHERTPMADGILIRSPFWNIPIPVISRHNL